MIFLAIKEVAQIVLSTLQRIKRAKNVWMTVRNALHLANANNVKKD